jgi:hypothetical protein
VVRTRDSVDDYVLRFVSAWLASDRVGPLNLVTETNESDPDSVAAVLRGLRQSLKQVEQDYDDDLVDGRRYKVKRDKILAEMKAIERDNRRSGAGAALAGILSSPEPALAFQESPLGIKRTVIGEHMVVRLLSAPRGRRGFDPETVDIKPLTTGATQ